MRSLKLIVNSAMALTHTGGVTFAHPGAKTGDTGTGKDVVRIDEIPDGVDNNEVRRLYAGTADITWLGHIAAQQRFVFRFEELGIGRIIRS